MKKFFLLLFSAVTLSAAVHAQDSTKMHHQHGGTAIKQRGDMMDQLSLTDEQKAKMQKLRDEQRTKMDSIRKSSLSEDDKMNQLKTVRENGHKSMEEVLTPEQKSKMMEMRKSQMEKRKAMKQGADSTK